MVIKHNNYRELANKIASSLLKKCGWIYCFKRGDKAVFLNRKDQVIKEFDSYNEAEKYANNNIHLINMHDAS